MVGAGISYLTAGVLNLVQPSVSSAFSSVSSPVVQQGLTYGTTGAITGFSLGTGMALANGENLGDALSIGGRSAAFGFGMGFASGAYSGYRYAKANNLDPWSGQFKLKDGHNIEIGNGHLMGERIYYKNLIALKVLLKIQENLNV